MLALVDRVGWRSKIGDCSSDYPVTFEVTGHRSAKGIGKRSLRAVRLTERLGFWWYNLGICCYGHNGFTGGVGTVGNGKR